MQYVFSSHIFETVHDLIEKLQCKLPQKVASTCVLEPQRISDVHEEGDLIAALVYVSSVKRVRWFHQGGSASFHCSDETNAPLYWWYARGSRD